MNYNPLKCNNCPESSTIWLHYSFESDKPMVLIAQLQDNEWIEIMTDSISKQEAMLDDQFYCIECLNKIN